MKGWGRMPDLPQTYKIPVTNIEHAVERLGAFVVIVVSLLAYRVTNLLMGKAHSLNDACSSVRW